MKIKETIRRGILGGLTGLFAHSSLLTLAAFGTEKITLDSDRLITFYLAYAGFGFFYAAVSIIFSIESWSILRRFITHALVTLPGVILAYRIFVPLKSSAQWLFGLIYLLAYVISFIIYLIHLRKEAKAINMQLSK